MEICPFCEEKKTEKDSDGNLLLCMDCAIWLGEQAGKADLINRSEW